MSRIVDFHTHILPRVDDGSRSLEESVAMLRKEAEQGVAHVVLTPHFYPLLDSPERFLERRAAAEELLRKEMEKYPDLPEISVGAEVFFFDGISDSDAIGGLTIAQKDCIMIEMPEFPWTERMYKELEDIHSKQGLTPVIAHLDRYLVPFQTRKVLDRLSRLPVLIQVNASFFLNKSTSAKALRMLKDGQIHLLGSDCHNMNSRTPNLGEAVELICKRLGDAPLKHISRCSDDVLGM